MVDTEIRTPLQAAAPMQREAHYLPKPSERQYIHPPKFIDKFARLDFDAPLIPVIAIFPIPETAPLQEHTITACGPG